jgi:hypothetical protein
MTTSNTTCVPYITDSGWGTLEACYAVKTATKGDCAGVDEDAVRADGDRLSGWLDALECGRCPEARPVRVPALDGYYNVRFGCSGWIAGRCFHG